MTSAVPPEREIRYSRHGMRAEVLYRGVGASDDEADRLVLARVYDRYGRVSHLMQAHEESFDALWHPTPPEEK